MYEKKDKKIRMLKYVRLKGIWYIDFGLNTFFVNQFEKASQYLGLFYFLKFKDRGISSGLSEKEQLEKRI